MKVYVTSQVNLDELCDSLRDTLSHKQVIDFVESLFDDSSDTEKLWRLFKKRCDEVVKELDS